MATVAAPANWQPIGEIVAGFRNECSEFEHLVQSLFDQLDQLRSELDRKAQEIERERQRVMEQRKETSRIAHQFEHQEAKLSEALNEIEELKNLVSRTGQDSSQRDALVRDLATARKELADARAELARGGGGGSGGEDGERVAALERERAALEAELELVRGRASELYESLAQERKSATEHRSETTTELKQLRRIVEKQAELLSERPAPAHAPPSERRLPARESHPTCEIGSDDVDDETLESVPSSDPVISSVMAQFAKLQKEVAERRKHRKPK
jgi:DNA repair exonuclease SbcCD ATPase subunit